MAQALGFEAPRLIGRGHHDMLPSKRALKRAKVTKKRHNHEDERGPRRARRRPLFLSYCGFLRVLTYSRPAARRSRAGRTVWATRTRGPCFFRGRVFLPLTPSDPCRALRARPPDSRSRFVASCPSCQTLLTRAFHSGRVPGSPQSHRSLQLLDFLRGEIAPLTGTEIAEADRAHPDARELAHRVTRWPSFAAPAGCVLPAG